MVNKREANNVIFVTLDWALANVHLLKFYPTAFLNNLSIIRLGHAQFF